MSLERKVMTGSSVGKTGMLEMNQNVSELINQLFARLCVYCNRWRYNYPSDEALANAKLIWTEEFINHGILSVAQLEQGLAMVCKRRSDYFPNLFDFITWCKFGDLFPDVEEVKSVYFRYLATPTLFDRTDFTQPRKRFVYWCVLRVKAKQPKTEFFDKTINDVINSVASEFEHLPMPKVLLERK